MMTLLSIVLSIAILALLLWVVAMAMEMLVTATGLPPQVRPLVVGIVAVFGLVAILGGYRIHW